MPKVMTNLPMGLPEGRAVGSGAGGGAASVGFGVNGSGAFSVLIHLQACRIV